ncbi:MAG TPA: RluA family pseudouridine synthase [Kiritimatiellia bacterium]|nr:RluA family pseudouridine synthase [Kiritimatiellia bacterium]
MPTPKRPQTQQWLVQGNERGALLLDFLVDKTGHTKRQAKRWLDQKIVFVNGQRVWMAKHILQPRDRVEFTLPLETHPSASSSTITIPILYRDTHYLIADKPPTLVTNQSPDSLEAVLSRQEGPVHAVHRLDRETSGCILFARTQEAKDRMIELFHDRAVLKVYRAIVLGSFPPGTQRTLRAPIEGKPAVTHLRVIRGGPLASHLELRLETGRTHQIRRHLLTLPSGLVGDKQYGHKHIDQPELRKAARHMLHAIRLSFPHPYLEKTVEVTSPLPPDYKACLKALRL